MVFRDFCDNFLWVSDSTFRPIRDGAGGGGIFLSTNIVSLTGHRKNHYILFLSHH
jgi:hypothetical protein